MSKDLSARYYQKKSSVKGITNFMTKRKTKSDSMYINDIKFYKKM